MTGTAGWSGKDLFFDGVIAGTGTAIRYQGNGLTLLMLLVGDVIAVLGSLNIIAAELDR